MIDRIGGLEAGTIGSARLVRRLVKFEGGRGCGRSPSGLVLREARVTMSQWNCVDVFTLGTSVCRWRDGGACGEEDEVVEVEIRLRPPKVNSE